MDALEKDKDRQLLIQIAANSKHLDSLQNQDISILTEMFHLEKIDNQREMFHRLRNKLCEILIIQREHYQDYLKLPKFKRIRVQTIDKITLFWQFIWLTFVHQKQQQKTSKRIELQKSNNLIQSSIPPNLNCYNYFPSYQTMNQPKLPYSPYPYFYNFPNYQFPQYYPDNQGIKYNPYYMQKQPSFIIEQQKNINQQSEVIFKNQHQSQQPQHKMDNQISNIINIQFLHCVCSGKNIDISQEFYSCTECLNFYHLSCLKIKKVDPKPCPLCYFAKINIFTENISRPIKSGWLQLNKQEYFVTKIYFDDDQMKIFNSCNSYVQSLQDRKSMWIQFSILKISDDVVNNGKKTNKTSFMISSHQLKKVQTRKWIQLKLKQITHQCLAFYIINLTKIKEEEAIVNHYNTLEKQINLIQIWRRHEQKENKKTIVDLIHPKTNKLIQLPIRGQQCDHLECQDLLYFYNLFKSTHLESNRLQCSYCKNNYAPNSKFITDNTIYQMLQNKQSNKNHKMELSQQGKLQWIAFDPNEQSESSSSQSIQSEV